MQKNNLSGKRMPCSRQQTVFFKGGYRVLHIFVAEINCQGRYDLADRLDNHNSAPNEYISGGGGPAGGTVAWLYYALEWELSW